MRHRAAIIVGAGNSLKAEAMTDVTRILSAIEQGDVQAAEQLLPLVCDELRQKMAQETSGHTLRATALATEPYMRLLPSASEPGEILVSRIMVSI